MATHSSIHAGKIPWTEEPGRLWSLGPQRVRHDWALVHTYRLLSQQRNPKTSLSSLFWINYSLFAFQTSDWTWLKKKNKLLGREEWGQINICCGGRDSCQEKRWEDRKRREGERERGKDRKRERQMEGRWRRRWKITKFSHKPIKQKSKCMKK